MTILFVEDMILGHHVPYLQALTDRTEYDSVIISPEEIPCISKKQILFPKVSFDSRRYRDYLSCISFIEETAVREKIDLIHFLDGDKIMRYFGTGLDRLSKHCPVVITFHRNFRGAFRKLSYRIMCNGRTPVVHTEDFRKALIGYGISGVIHIEYPSFLSRTDQKVKNKVPVIGMFGGTRYDKGLDILLDALSRVKTPFHLIVAGREADFTKEDIEKMSAPIKDRVTLDLRFLTDDELSAYWDRTDLVVLPYRSIFDGASGQLTEGVNRGLPIVGPSHGSLGEIIRRNHLGVTFSTEDREDLAQKIEAMLQNPFEYDDTAKRYQHQMNPMRFGEDYLKLYNSLVEQG
ncbi:MAG: glycosyltransferase family 4 protein [Eubacteriales bacterium]